MRKRGNETWRVVIDTNIWISFLIGKHLAGLHRHIDGGRVEVVTCEEQLRELIDVLNRPRIRKYIPNALAEEFLDLLSEIALMVEPVQGPAICRDPKDDYLLYTALAARADYLVTGDNDLLTLDHIAGTKIIVYADFEMILNGIR